MRSRLREIDQYLETVIMAKVLAAGDVGVTKGVIEGCLNPWAEAQRLQVIAECPGWFALSSVKRGNKLHLVIQRLAREHKLKLENGTRYDGPRLFAANALDRIVAALEEVGDDSSIPPA